MSQKVRKAIIPVAGYGTRFLPATKNQPKEILPIVDKPIIQYIVADAVKSGITDIIIVTNANKRPIEDYFDHSPELERWLGLQGKKDLLKIISNIPKMANFIYIRQKGPMGNGTPILNAREIVGDEPFVVYWGDEFFLSDDQPYTQQLISTYEKYNNPVCAVFPTDRRGLSRYGIIKGKKVEPNVFKIEDMIEKPGPDKAPSNLAMACGYVLTPDIFPILAKTKPGKSGEVWLADAMATLSKKRPFYARIVGGELFDAGTVLGWLESNVKMALLHPEHKKEFSLFLKKLVK